MSYTIFTRKGCQYCVKAKAALTNKNLPFNEIMIDRDITRDDFIKRFPDVKTVPHITKDDDKTVVGSYNNLLDHLNPPLE